MSDSQIFYKAAKFVSLNKITCSQAIAWAAGGNDDDLLRARLRFSDVFWLMDAIAPSWFGDPRKQKNQEYRVLALLLAHQWAKYPAPSTPRTGEKEV